MCFIIFGWTNRYVLLMCTHNKNMTSNIYFPFPTLRWIRLPRYGGMPPVSPHTPPVLDRPQPPPPKKTHTLWSGAGLAKWSSEWAIEEIRKSSDWAIEGSMESHRRMPFILHSCFGLEPYWHFHALVQTNQYRLSYWLNGHLLGKVFSYKPCQWRLMTECESHDMQDIRPRR